jgi:hypothetical protein
MRSRIRVLEPAVSRDLTTLETARAELGFTEADTSQDEQIMRMIHEMSSVVVGYCGQTFAEETVEETFWPEGCGEQMDSIVLDRTPVTAVVSIELDGSELGTGDFDLDERKGILYHLGGYNHCCCCWRWFRSLVVTYTAGYPLLDGLPEAIEKAALILVRDQYNAIGRDPDLRSETIPGVHAYTLGGITAGANRSMVSGEVAQLLDPYRRFFA